MSKRHSRVQRFLHWLFGSPFEEVSTVIGDPTSPELQTFNAETEHMQHQLDGAVRLPSGRRGPAQGHRR